MVCHPKLLNFPALFNVQKKIKKCCVCLDQANLAVTHGQSQNHESVIKRSYQPLRTCSEIQGQVVQIIVRNPGSGCSNHCEQSR